MKGAYIKMNVSISKCMHRDTGGKCTKKFFFWKRAWLVTTINSCEKTLKKKINSENTVSNEGCLYQNACGYIKMNASISKCIQNVPIVLRIFTRESATLVTTINSSDKLYQNECGYIKMHAVVHGVGNALGKFFWKKGHDLSQLLIVVKRHWKKK